MNVGPVQGLSTVSIHRRRGRNGNPSDDPMLPEEVPPEGGNTLKNRAESKDASIDSLDSKLRRIEVVRVPVTRREVAGMGPCIGNAGIRLPNPRMLRLIADFLQVRKIGTLLLFVILKTPQGRKTISDALDLKRVLTQMPRLDGAVACKNHVEVVSELTVRELPSIVGGSLQRRNGIQAE